MKYVHGDYIHSPDERVREKSLAKDNAKGIIQHCEMARLLLPHSYFISDTLTAAILIAPMPRTLLLKQWHLLFDAKRY